MRKSFTLFFAILFISITLGLNAEPLVYDQVEYETRFSYSIGFAATFMGGGNAYISHSNVNISNDITMEYDSTYMGLYYQAEWRRFALIVSPHLYSMRVESVNNYVYDSSGQSINLGFLGSETEFFGISISPLYRHPLVDKSFQFGLYAGPVIELNTDMNFGLSGIVGLDLGYKLTSHHALIFGISAGVSILSADGGAGAPLGLKSMIVNNNTGSTFNSAEGGFKLQFLLGIRTFIYDEVFYYQGKEVGRRR
jgi:hypothetical protein